MCRGRASLSPCVKVSRVRHLVNYRGPGNTEYSKALSGFRLSKS
jgi:hypothetical protein